MAKIEGLIEELIEASQAKEPTVVISKRSTCTAADIKAWERTQGFSLPDDFKVFAQQVGECFLHVKPGQATHTGSVRLLPLKHVVPFVKALGWDESDDVADTWFAFADHHDSNWMCFDLATVKGHDNRAERSNGRGGTCFAICTRRYVPNIARRSNRL